MSLLLHDAELLARRAVARESLQPLAHSLAEDLKPLVGRAVYFPTEKALLSLEAPIARVAGFDTPFPYTLENEYLPSVERISKAIRDTAAF